MSAKVKIKMNKYFNGWSFKTTYWDEFKNEWVTIKRTTNKNGDGLWVFGEHEPKQILENCQFTLSKNRRTAYQQIRRYIIKQYIED